MNDLVYNKNMEDLIQRFDFYIVPVANPDG